MKRLRGFCLFITMAFLLSCVPYSVSFADKVEGTADGTADSDANDTADGDVDTDTVTISSADALIEFSEKCHVDTATSDITVILTNDIDMSGKQFDGLEIFAGTFDGRNHTISGVKYVGAGNIDGFFRYTTEGAVIENLTIKGTFKTIDDEIKLGGVVGANAGLIRNVRFDGSVRARSGVGGISGINQTTGVIEDCRTAGTIGGYYQTGGVAGLNYGTISGCISECDINRDISWVQTNDETQLTDIIDNLTSSEESASVVSSMDTGGIAGYTAGIVNGCTNTGEVGYPHTGYNIGGIAGRQAGYLTGCSNKGTVYGRKDVGGVVGQMEPYITLDDSSSVQSATQSLYYKMNKTANDIKSAESAAREESERIRNEITTGTPVTEEELAANSNNAKAQSERLNSDLRSMNKSTAEVLNRLVEAIEGMRDSDAPDIYEDVSEESIETATDGKVEQSVNRGVIEGDINVGGITGSMAIDSEDPEGNAAGQQTVRLGERYLTECVLSDCRNYGYVKAKNDGAGGITGYQSLGIIYKGEAYGMIQSELGSYVGGICGDSYATIRSCYSDCEVKGERYVGGIAGGGYSIYDSAAMVTVNSSGGNKGAIAGAIHSDDDEATTPTEEWIGERVSGNHYYDDALYGIDGVSYEGVTDGVSHDELIAMDGVPTAFGRVQLLCVADDKIMALIELKYGDRLDAVTLPELDEKEGYEGVWPDLSGETAIRNRTIVAEYEKRLEALKSEEKNDNDKPLGFIDGSFSSSAVFHIKSDGEPASEDMFNESVIYSISLALDNEVDFDGEAEKAGLPKGEAKGDVYKLRITTPTDTVSGVFVSSDGSAWEEVKWQEKGSYTELSAPAGTRFVKLCYENDDAFLPILIAAVGVCVVVILAVVLLVRRRKKKRVS